MFSLFRRPKNQFGVIFDIDSASIGAGFVSFQIGEMPRIIHSIRERIPFQKDIDPKRYLDDMIKTLGEVSALIIQEGLDHKETSSKGFRIDHVFYALSSPWSVTRTKTISVKKGYPSVLSKEEVDRVLSEQEKIFEKDLLLEKDAKSMPKLSVIEKRVVQIRLDGKEVPNLVKTKINQADISFFESLAPKAITDRISEASLITPHPKDTNMFSFPLAAFSVIRDSFHDIESFVMLDVGGELSNISLVRDGLILETASFPLGRNFVSRQVSEAFDISNEEAVSVIKTYFDGHAEKELSTALSPVLEASAFKWSKSFYEVLSRLLGGTNAPQNLFIVADSDFDDIFINALKADAFVNQNIRKMPFSFTVLGKGKFTPAVQFEKYTQKDPTIALLAAFAGKMIASVGK